MLLPETVPEAMRGKEPWQREIYLQPQHCYTR